MLRLPPEGLDADRASTAALQRLAAAINAGAGRATLLAWGKPHSLAGQLQERQERVRRLPPGSGRHELAASQVQHLRAMAEGAPATPDRPARHPARRHGFYLVVEGRTEAELDRLCDDLCPLYGAVRVTGARGGRRSRRTCGGACACRPRACSSGRTPTTRPTSSCSSPPRAPACAGWTPPPAASWRCCCPSTPRPAAPARLLDRARAAVARWTDPRPRLERRAAREVERGKRHVLQRDRARPHRGDAATTTWWATAGRAPCCSTTSRAGWPPAGAGWLASLLLCDGGPEAHGAVRLAVSWQPYSPFGAGLKLTLAETGHQATLDLHARRGTIPGRDVRNAVRDVDRVQQALADGATRLLAVTVVVTCEGPSREACDAVWRQVTGRLNARLLHWRPLDDRHALAFRQQTPGGGQPIWHPLSWDTSTLAFSWPCVGETVDMGTGPVWGTSAHTGRPLQYDPFDRAHGGPPAPHVCVIGPTGNGKSVAFFTVAAEYLTEPDPPHFRIVDPKGDYEARLRRAGRDAAPAGRGRAGEPQRLRPGPRRVAGHPGGAAAGQERRARGGAQRPGRRPPDVRRVAGPRSTRSSRAWPRAPSSAPTPSGGSTASTPRPGTRAGRGCPPWPTCTGC